jgi:hypothetical protein
LNIPDPILLGHNPFFGIDHLSQQEGDKKAQRFEQTSGILEILSFAHEQGVRAMMMSTHPRGFELCEALASESFGRDWRIYPLVPYLQKYVRGANEVGLLNMVRETLSQADFRQKISLMWQSGRGVISKDFQKMLTTLVDVELLPFKSARLGAIFLHDALTDLALGLGLEAVFDVFREHVAAHYGVPAGFATKNLKLFCERMAQRGWSDLLVMASFNAAGFYMNPSLSDCEEAVSQPGLNLLAMNTLASGRLAPDEAYAYLSCFPQVRSVVVGMSKREHVVQTVSAIRRHLPCAKQTAS